MGREVASTLRRDGDAVAGRAFLETDELVFRGEGVRLRIAFGAVTGARADDGALEVDHDGGTTVLDVGPEAARWADRILHPKTVVEKLGVKPGQRVVLRGVDDAGFAADLEARGAAVVTGPDADHLFVAVESAADLAGLGGLVPLIARNGAVWTIRRKGRADLTEADVRAAGLAAGLVDVKVVRFSDTHTAEKFVIPVAAR